MPSGEIPYFEDPDYSKTEREKFERLFHGAQGKKAIGMKRPNYLAKSECPGRIHEVIPKVKLIVVLRDPIERAISAYFHYIREGFIPPCPIEEGMIKILDGKYRQKWPRSREIVEFGFYYQHLKRYFAVFDEEQVCILFHKDILQNRLKQIQKIYQFLGIDVSYIPQQLDSRPQAALYSLWRLWILRLRNNSLYIYSRERTRLYFKEQSSLDKMICFAINGIDSLFLSRLLCAKRPNISESLRRRLSLLYKHDIRDIGKLLKINCWNSIRNSY